MAKELDNKKMWESLYRQAPKDGWFQLAYRNAIEQQGLICDEMTGEIVSIEPEFKVEPNKWYVCIKQIPMKGIYRGCLYRADSKGLISSNTEHHYAVNIDNLTSEYFRPATPEEITTAKHGIAGISSKKAERKLGEMIAEMKSPEETPHKFKVGDFIINDYCCGKVVELTDDAYLLDTEQGIPFSYEHNARLWDITKDAKDGDVLSDYHEAYDNPLIFILKKFECVNFGLVRPSDYSSYCFLTASDRQMFKEGTYHHKHNIKPATKEQRDLLFQKMKEAGYEWDADKKELNISQRMISAEAKEALLTDGLTDFEKCFQGMCHDENQKFAKACCVSLMALARKQIASEIDVDKMEESFDFYSHPCSRAKAFRFGIEATIKAIEKG